MKPLWVACHTGHCCPSEVLQHGRMIDGFPPSSTMQARPQGGGFGVRFGVIPNRDFLSTSGEATKATAVAYVVLRISWHICMWAHTRTRTCTHTYYNFRKYKMTWFSMALWNTLSILSLSFSLYVLFPPPPQLKSSPFSNVLLHTTYAPLFLGSGFIILLPQSPK